MRTTALWVTSLTLAMLVIAGVVTMTVAGAVAWSGASWHMPGWGMGGMSGHMQQMMGGGADTSNAPATVGGAAEPVAIRDFAFTPGNLQVPVGAMVTWTNDDAAPHSATAKDGSWDTGILNKGESRTLTFDKAGDYTYYCKVHPNMVARLQVR